MPRVSRGHASAVPIRSFTLSECRSPFAAQVFRWGSTVDRFLFLLTMFSTSSDSEMGFDSEDSAIYYIAEENDDSRRLSLTSQTEFSKDVERADLYAADSLANKQWTAKYQEADADKELERALTYRIEGNDM